MEYTLRNQYLTVVFQSFGGELHSVRNAEGCEYLWQGNKEYWGGQSPVLFPICGSIRDNTIIGNGKTTTMPRHGVARKNEFAVKDRTDDSITFSLDSTEEMLGKFPYPFRLEISYVLSGNAIRVCYCVVNTGTETMPFFIGGHPGFNCPLKDGEDFTDYRIEFEKEETLSVPALIPENGLLDVSKRTPLLDHESILPLKHSLFDDDALVLDGIQSRSVKMISEKTGAGVQLDFADFRYLLIWSALHEAPFVCLEPWTGISTCSDESDVFEEKRNVQCAKAGETRTFEYTITVL